MKKLDKAIELKSRLIEELKKRKEETDSFINQLEDVEVTKISHDDEAIYELSKSMQVIAVNLFRDKSKDSVLNLYADARAFRLSIMGASDDN